MRMVAFVADLMDRSRLAGATASVEFAADADAAAGAEVVVVDLARFAELVTAIRSGAPTARIVAYGPHVDTALLQRARVDGADVVMPRSQFFRDPAAATGP
jgi:hypothetical protein